MSLISDINKPTTLILKNGYGRYTVTVDHSDLDIVGMFNIFESLLLAAGFEKASIEEYYNESGQSR